MSHALNDALGSPSVSNASLGTSGLDELDHGVADCLDRDFRVRRYLTGVRLVVVDHVTIGGYAVELMTLPDGSTWVRKPRSPLTPNCRIAQPSSSRRETCAI